MSSVVVKAWKQANGSESVDGFGIEQGTDKLVIRFKNKSGGSTYRYNTSKVQSTSYFERLGSAESVGREFRELKGTLDDFEALGQASIVEPTGEEIPYGSSMSHKESSPVTTSPDYQKRLGDFLANLGMGGNAQTAYF